MQDGLANLAGEAARLRENLAWDPEQVSEIHKLYSEYIKLGCAFPADLEEHGLRLILKFMRPDDDNMARRLATVLEMQGKEVPADLTSLAVRNFALPYEKIALRERDKALRNAENSLGSCEALHERLFLVVGLPKSASRLMVSALAAMHPIERFRKQTPLPYSTGHHDLNGTEEVRHDGFVGFADGGIVHSHLNPTNINRHALAHLGLGCVITIRHPADHIAAFYCHLRRVSHGPLLVDEIRARLADDQCPAPRFSADTYTRENEPNRLFFHGNIFPIDIRFLAPSADIDDAIAHLIAGGYLYSALTWIVSWELLRIRNTSTVVRYEDFVANPEVVLRRVNHVMFPGNPDDAVASGAKVFAEKNYDTSLEPDIYPRGSSGAQGIWQNYFSPENRRLYNSVCEQFMSAHPYGQLLKRFYPDPFVTPSEF